MSRRVTIVKSDNLVSIKIKWPGKEVSPYHIPIYGGMVYFVTDREVFADVRSYMTESVEHDDTQRFSLGCVQELMNNETGARCYVMGVFDGDMATLVHELGHLTIDILTNAGIDITEQNSEAFCYLLDTLYQRFAPDMKGESKSAPESATKRGGGK